MWNRGFVSILAGSFCEKKNRTIILFFTMDVKFEFLSFPEDSVMEDSVGKERGVFGRGRRKRES